MRLKEINRKQILLWLCLMCLSLMQAKSVISAPTSEEYEQFRGRDSIFVDINNIKHTIEHLSAKISQRQPIEKIADGYYRYAEFNGEPDFIEVKEGKYRGLVLIPGKVGIESVSLSAWQSISKSDLKFVRIGVIYNSSTPKTPYWCSKEAPEWQPLSRKTPIIYCTSKGWTSLKPETLRVIF